MVFSQIISAPYLAKYTGFLVSLKVDMKYGLNSEYYHPKGGNIFFDGYEGGFPPSWLVHNIENELPLDTVPSSKSIQIIQHLGRSIFTTATLSLHLGDIRPDLGNIGS